MLLGRRGNAATDVGGIAAMQEPSDPCVRCGQIVWKRIMPAMPRPAGPCPS
jgi:hypothetical protein